MGDTRDYLRKLLVIHPLREPLLRSVMETLRFPRGSRGLDAGCGTGLPTFLLAEAVGSSGHVTGVDIEPGFVSYASQAAVEHNLSERTSFHQGDVNGLPFEDAAFDWAWSADCVGYAPGDPSAPIGELVRVVKPGGTVALLIYSSQQLLPGYPRLEARLNATSSGIAPFSHGTAPGRHYYRALGWLRKAGLLEAQAEAFVHSVHAPLSHGIRDALAALLEMRWTDVELELAPDDWKEYQRLCRPGALDFILDCENYYAFFTYSLFYGQVAER
jgi:ubiquinone/menaquinone biosynthesis C-methylase UbiE